MMGYVAGAAMLAAAGAVSWATIQSGRAETMRIERDAALGQLHTCGGRLDAVLRDVKDDNEIDDLDLLRFPIPDGWLLPADPTDP